VAWCLEGAKLYAKRIGQGFSEEHARSLIPFDVRQNWIVSCNVRSFMHLLDLRWKADAQLECQDLCDLMWPYFETWVPAIALEAPGCPKPAPKSHRMALGRAGTGSVARPWA
jgi:thymidylate synthase (FAD)